MGVCSKCIYYSLEEANSSFIKGRRINSNHTCLCPSNDRQDFVTGEIKHSNCYERNNFEECLFYDEGIIENDKVEEI